jgi:5-formaminoimidazole-4-carboxamide-1-(beta)-D-ribofuranosyl 5'-monophosphate synthetase
VCKEGKHRTYDEHYRTRTRGDILCDLYSVGCVDETIVVKEWADMVGKDVIDKLIEKNSIFIPHRSFEVYLGYDNINDRFPVPIFGNRALLQAEERPGSKWAIPKDQYYLLKTAGIRTPKRYDSPSEIDGPVIVKASKGLMKKARGFEREFHVVKSGEEYENLVKSILEKNSDKTAEEKIIIEKEFRAAPIEQFVSEDYVNANFFYSPLYRELEILGTDTRTQFPKPSGDEHKHHPVSLRESKLEGVIELGKKFVKVTQREYAPGIIGPFALQLVADGEERYYVYDVSLRNPGSPDANASPYPWYLFGKEMSFGRRIAMEIREAAQQNRLEEILT